MTAQEIYRGLRDEYDAQWESAALVALFECHPIVGTSTVIAALLNIAFVLSAWDLFFQTVILEYLRSI
jgi:hypothetical protein